MLLRRLFATSASASAAQAAPKRELSRHTTRQGHTSLRRHLFGGGNVFQQWASKMTVDTYPVLFAIFAGVSLAAWFGVRGLMYNPDAKFNKVQRSQTIRTNDNEGRAWIQHHKTLRGEGFHAQTAGAKQE